MNGLIRRRQTFCNGFRGTRLAVCSSLHLHFGMDQALQGLSELCASVKVHKEIHSGTSVAKILTKSHEKIEGICKLCPSSQSRLEHRKNSKNDQRNGKHEELDGQSDEHFGDADLFAGQTGRRLAAPANNLSQSDSSDDGGCQDDDWTTYCQKKTVKHAIQHVDYGFIPEVVFVDVGLPGNPLRAHLVEALDLIHGSDCESCKHKSGHTDNNCEADGFCRHASLSSQGKQNTDTSFC